MPDGLTVVVGVAEPGVAWVTPDSMANQAAGKGMGMPDEGRETPDQRLAAFEHWQRRCTAAAETFLGLAARRRIHPLELRAGDEIALVRAVRSGSLSGLAAVSYCQRLAADTSGGVPMWMTIEEIERTRYLPWRGWAVAFPIGGATLEDLTGWFVTDGLTIDAARTKARLRYDRVLPLLRRSLWHYAVRAGWGQGDSPPSIHG